MKINYNLKIQYTLGRFNLIETYKDVLSDGQLKTLQEDIEKSFLIENVYCKIDCITGDKDGIEIRLGIYTDQIKKVFITSKVYTFYPKLDSAYNFIKQGYEYLKTLPDYAGAIDVLEE